MDNKIRTFMEEQFLIEFDETFPENSNLFMEGVLDSFGYVELCHFLEREYDIKFSEREMTSNVLVSLTQIQEAVALKVKEKDNASAVEGR
ncbi:acyl carrier protein [Kordiimonas pumila]|uniref:Acyl carrier protein n=1 Tax=Kordiimonas pumila TaxID=2161677 RepID=A0ABV7D3F3_9PROT|nr:acyl carrier protein [Kordiimonas pumila]